MGLSFVGELSGGGSGPRISILKAPSSFLCVPNAGTGEERMEGPASILPLTLLRHPAPPPGFPQLRDSVEPSSISASSPQREERGQALWSLGMGLGMAELTEG